MKHWLLLAICLIAAGCRRVEQPQAVAVAGTTAGGDLARGRELMGRYGCTGCHIIPGAAGPRGTLGPPLQSMGSRPAINFRFPNTPENMVRWLQDPRSMDPQSTMPNVGVTPADAADMTAYLFSLR